MDNKAYQTIKIRLRELRDHSPKGSDSYIAYQMAINVVDNAVHPVCNTTEEKPKIPSLKFLRLHDNGDATATYSVDFDGTLRDLLINVRDRKEWGCIQEHNIWGDTIVEYSRGGNLLADPVELSNLLNKKIKINGANGGWGRMDYWIDFIEDSPHAE